MRATVKYENGTTEAIIRLADGGIATCFHNGSHMVTEYYQSRTFDKDPDFDKLAEGKKYIKDWENKHFIDSEIIKDALNWLVSPAPEFEISEHFALELPNITRKECTRCKEVKGNDDFFKDVRNKTGLTSHCRICKNK